MLRFFTLLSILVFMIPSHNKAMNENKDALEHVLYETASIIAEMCYRKKEDLSNEKKFEFLEPTDISRSVIFSLAENEADNIYSCKEWQNLYPEGFKKLISLWQHATIVEARKINDRQHLLDIIDGLTFPSKKKLLSQIKSYQPSCLKSSLGLIMSVGLDASSLYCAYYCKNVKVKIAVASFALMSLISTCYFIKKTTSFFKASSFWKGCSNFQKAIELCEGIEKKKLI